MKKFWLIFIILFVVLLLFADSALKFDTLDYNFGKIKEENGPYSYTFYFTNVSKIPIKLTKVKAGCGCTVASWSTGEILPGTKGYVKVVFDSNNRPGNFHKKVTVFTNADSKPITLNLTGFVIGTPGKFYPKNTIGNLQFDKNYLNVGRIKDNEIKKFRIGIYNRDGSDLTIKIDSKPKWAEIKIDKTTLKPKEKGVLNITIDANKITDYGLSREPITFVLNGKPNHKKYYIKCYKYHDFSKLTQEQRRNAPRIKLLNKQSNFAYYKKNKNKYEKLMIYNAGKTDLKIFNVFSTDKIKIISYPKIIKPTETKELVFELKNKEKLSSFRGHIKIFSNDPAHFETILTISGSIVKPKKRKKPDLTYISVKELWKNRENPQNIPAIKKFSLNHKFKKTVILDVRSSQNFQKDHLKNSINIPLEADILEMSINKLDKETLYIIIGQDFEQADTAAKTLIKHGLKNVVCTKGSFLEIWGITH